VEKEGHRVQSECGRERLEKKVVFHCCKLFGDIKISGIFDGGFGGRIGVSVSIYNISNCY